MRVLFLFCMGLRLCWEVPMGKEDPRSSPGFDRWLKANAAVGSILAIGVLAMALAGLYSPPPDRVTEFSSIARK
jgi:hypothetical protein